MNINRWLIGLLLIGNLCPAPILYAADALTLDAVLQKAQAQNPDIIAARQAWKVKMAEVRPAGTWENPKFSYTDEQFPTGIAGVAPEPIKHYRIEQMIPFPGKLTADARMKYHEALIAEAQARAKTLEVLQNVRMRFYQLYLTDQKILLAQQSVDILSDALRTAQARVGSNQSSTSDVFMAQTELGAMKNNLFEQTQQRVLIELELNTLLNQPTDTVLGPAQAPELLDVPISLADLETLARRNNPDYLAAMHEINHAKIMQWRNRLAFAPDFGVMYEHESAPPGPPGRMIGFSVSFPLWLQRPWGEYRSAQAHVDEAQAQSQSMENEVVERVHQTYIQTTTDLQLTRNYLNDILPSALANVKIARQQYASGQTDFVRLLEAFRTWIDTHNRYQEQLYSYGEHASELARWAGVDLSQAAPLLQKHTTPEEFHHEH